MNPRFQRRGAGQEQPQGGGGSTATATTGSTASTPTPTPLAAMMSQLSTRLQKNRSAKSGGGKFSARKPSPPHCCPPSGSGGGGRKVAKAPSSLRGGRGGDAPRGGSCASDGPGDKKHCSFKENENDAVNGQEQQQQQQRGAGGGGGGTNGQQQKSKQATTGAMMSVFGCGAGAGVDSSQSMQSLMGVEFDFDAMYKLLKPLRSGSFAVVYEAEHRLSKDLFAVKQIDRRKLKPKDDRAVYREVEILRALGTHPGIILLVDFFEKPCTFHVVLELARGGDMFDRLAKRSVYTEREARRLALKLLETVQFMHDRGVTHRDMKAENVLLMSDDESEMRIADFGFATYYDMKPEGGEEGAPKRLTTRCGTPAYVAPEIILGVPYNQMVDMWSCGVLLFILLGGYPPFAAENKRELFRKIRAADFTFDPKHWDSISVDVKKLVSSFLVPDPDTRVDATTALRENAWLNCPDEESLSGKDLSSSLTNMRLFNARRKLKGAVFAVTWAVRASFWNMETVTFSRNEAQTETGLTTTSAEAIDGNGGSAAAVGTSDADAAATGVKKMSARKSGPTASRKFSELYELSMELRTGSFATVWKGRSAQPGSATTTTNGDDQVEDSLDGDDSMSHHDNFAIKVVSRADLCPKNDAAVLNEVAILQSVKNPDYIVPLVDFFEERDYFYLVMDLMKGGDVFDRIVKRKHYTELDARNLSRTLLRAVEHIHKHQVAHRDLKPQNLLLTCLYDDSDIKVADFGFARRVHTPNSLTTRCGTPTYVAPEILKNHPHDEKVDLWSVGVIIYTILVGYPPFLEDNQQHLFQKVRCGEYEFYEEDWIHVSNEAKDLIQGLLVVDPSKRMTAPEALRSDWMRDLDDRSLSSRDLSGSQSELRRSKTKLKLQGAVHALRWIAKPEEKEKAKSLACFASA